MITIERNNLVALLNASSKDETRPNLQSIYFDVPKKMAVATCGHMLYQFPIEVPEGEEHSVLISAESLRTALKVWPKEKPYFNFQKDESGTYKSFGLTLEVVNAQFPDYETVIPKHEQVNFHYATISAAILERLVKIAKESDRGNKQPSITFCFGEGENDRIVVETLHGNGVIMPMRGNRKSKKEAA